MDWREEGVLLSARRHGETAAIIEVLTRAHGRHLGVVPGGASRRMAPVLQPGTQLDLTWRARLADHIGSFRVEPVRSRAAHLGDPLALAAMSSVLALLSVTLAERESHAALYDRSVALLDMIGEGPIWPLAYLRWEMALLEELGFGLDLDRCAVTGQQEGLVFISPRTGRAVSRDGAGAWGDRLLPLSPDLVGRGHGTAGGVLEGLGVTGHFLAQLLAESLGHRDLPAARGRFVDRLARGADGA